jgi:acyl dehydratase
MPDFKPTGKYLEDIVPGAEALSPGRTITSADVDMFAEWTGNTSPAKRPAPDGRRVVDPLLLVNLADALFQRLGCVEGTGYCNLGWTWSFSRPVYEWDTIWVRTHWDGARHSKSIEGVGIVEMTLSLLNQHDEEVASAKWAVMILSRDKPAAWKTA